MRILALALLAYAARAQTAVSVCEPVVAISALSPERHDSVTLSRSERESKIAAIRTALAQSGDDLFLNRWLIELQPEPQTGILAAEFHEKLAKHPGDPRLRYLYARALVGNDTPAAIQSLAGADGPRTQASLDLSGFDRNLLQRSLSRSGQSG